MTHDVFISYAAEDESTAKAVEEKLSASGINSWASFKVEPGEDWLKEIIGAIKQSQVFVLVFSSASNVSKFVEHEAQAAFLSKKETLIIPFIIEDVTPTEKFEFIMSGRQYLRAAPPKEEDYAKLTSRVSRWLSRQGSGAENAGKAGSKKAAKKTAKKAAKKPSAAIDDERLVRVLKEETKRLKALVEMKRRAEGAPAKQSPPSALASGSPEALLSHITAAAKEWPAVFRRKSPSNGAPKFFLSFLGLRHGATADSVLAVHGTSNESESASKQHFVLHYPAKGLSVYCERRTRKVSLIAVKALDSARWRSWSRKQPDLKFLSKHRRYISGRFGEPNSKIEMSRLNPEILDYDFAGLRGRSGYVAFYCPASGGNRCTSLQVHWLH